MDSKSLEEFTGWLVAGGLGAAMGVRTFMTLWSKERAAASKADVSNERSQAEIDVIALLRSQLDALRSGDAQRTQQIDQMRILIDQQATDLHALNILVRRLNIHVTKMGQLLMQNNIEVPDPPEPFGGDDFRG